MSTTIIDKVKKKEEKIEKEHATIYAPKWKLDKFRAKCDKNKVKYNHIWLAMLDEFIKED